MNTIINRLDDLPAVIDTHSLARLTHGRLTMRMLDYALGKYARSGRLVRIKRGLYSKTADPFYVASRLYRGYIGLSSALYMHRLKTEVEGSVLVCVARPMRQTRFLGKTLMPVNLSRLAFGSTLVQQGGFDVPVSTYPKTVFDMLYRPAYANYFDLYRALHERRLAPGEWRALYRYVLAANLATARRAGYVLEREAPVWFVKALRRRSDSTKGASFFLKHSMRGYSPAWRLFDDIGVDRWKNAE